MPNEPQDRLPARAIPKRRSYRAATERERRLQPIARRIW